MNSDNQSPFGEVIFAYTRSQPIADDDQGQVSKLALARTISDYIKLGACWRIEFSENVHCPTAS